MSDQGSLKSGLLFIIATSILFTALTAFAGDKPSISGGSMELKHQLVGQEKLNVKDLDEEVSHLEVVDSKGNAYLLIPLRTTGGNKPVMAEDGKIIVEYVHPYAGRLGN